MAERLVLSVPPKIHEEISCGAPSNSPNRRFPGDMFGRGKNNGFLLTAPKFLNHPGHPFLAHSGLNSVVIIFSNKF